MAGLRQVVDPPSFTPIPYGLLTTVEWPQQDGNHWLNGITYQPMCDLSGTSVGSTTYNDCLSVTGGSPGIPQPPAPLVGTISTVARGATPFTTYAEFDCPPVGNQQAQATAEKALSMAEPWQVERAFWTGIAGGQKIVFPHLAANGPVSDVSGVMLQTSAVPVTGVSGDVLDIVSALGMLEQALGNCYDGVGVIHVPEVALPSLDAWGLVRASGPVMKTLNGNKVSVGTGYPGSGPDGATRTGGSCWMYGTGNVFGFRSDVRVRAPQGAQSMDRQTNTVRMIAERTYVLGWDCCHFAINAALGTPKGT